ncbi:2,3-diaminopropionate biosynthesis protein SbnB [Fulvivirga ligni]|uniref:2,3-diaminopropionate biosynthesis protein SbnB n=1 Tax=Fulvivirga ligni TaxID=2904246 RepID=UPI001F48AF92|nr:2,3-diaminopropionate biosynthesis protein SbnB [Fulvivirga ligni]UII23754.1 2,3-diaminopropionate biosynthesis protein SbnB [Fulvivirga ligni]
MIYLNENDIKQQDLDWSRNVEVIANAITCIKSKDISQPVKPYLRYGNLKNRIIAMPAYIGGDIHMSGIKWIASFPDNIKKGLVRAHSVIVLNEADTGLPVGILNSGSISAIRTASVSGLVLKEYMKARKPRGLKIGITGFGPIGQYHLSMCREILGNTIDEVAIYDLKGISLDTIPENTRDKIRPVTSWEEAYEDADVFITCTVSSERYIDKKPKVGSLHLNVSLRDYKSDVYPHFVGGIVVDDWEEVCRENTDIEQFHKINGLQKADVYAIQDIIADGVFSRIPVDQPIMFNPMGMAVFDIAMSNHYMKLAMASSSGLALE